MTDRSGRGEQRYVCPLLLCHCLRDVMRYGRFEALRVHVVTNEAEEIRCQLADGSLGCELLESLDVPGSLSVVRTSSISNSTRR